MHRRDFLKTSLLSGLAYSGVPLIRSSQAAEISAIFPALDHRILVFIYLSGGPDLRHLMPPVFDDDVNSYGYQHWQVRAASHNLDATNPASWQQRWENDYSPFTSGTTEFGILNQAGWLQSMWNAGNVSVVNNVLNNTSRNHAHCQLILDQGNVDSTAADIERPGWGGRLAQHSNRNVVSLTSTPRNFCFGGVPDNPEGRTDAPLISMPDSRSIALFHPQSGEERTSRGEIARSLKSYYASLRHEASSGSVYQRFIDHEDKARSFGNQITAGLESEPIPAAIEALYSGGDALHRTYFGRQIRNLRDSLVLTNILNFNVASMEYPGWDTHKTQKDAIEPKLNDLFGTGKALDTLYQELPNNISDQLVFVVAGEFGRQLKANGAGGTDHGRGNSLLIIGNQVNGTQADKTSSVHGDMFPLAEMDRLNQSSPDIIGQTEIDHVLAPLCDAISAGAGDAVFPNRASRIKEAHFDMSGLFG